MMCLLLMYRFVFACVCLCDYLLVFVCLVVPLTSTSTQPFSLFIPRRVSCSNKTCYCLTCIPQDETHEAQHDSARQQKGIHRIRFRKWGLDPHNSGEQDLWQVKLRYSQVRQSSGECHEVEWNKVEGGDLSEDGSYVVMVVNQHQHYALF